MQKKQITWLGVLLLEYFILHETNQVELFLLAGNYIVSYYDGGVEGIPLYASGRSGMM